MKCTPGADIVRPKRRVASLLALQAAALAGAANLWAGVTFDAATSTVTITHDPDITNPSDIPYVVRPRVPASNTLYPYSNQQISNRFGNSEGAPNSVAVGSIGQVTNATTASFILATGTGVAQEDPGNLTYPGSSSLRFDIDLWWNVTAGGFGPLANGYASLAVGGTVGVGGSASAQVHLEWKNQQNVALRTLFDETHNYAAGAGFTDTFTTARALNAPNASLPVNSKLHLVGFVEFRANNDSAPTDLNQFRGEFGGTPPTGHFRINQSGQYFDSENWESVPEGEDGLRSLPSGIGERAVFTTQGGDPSEGTSNFVQINDQVTLGSLDFVGDGSYDFSNGEGADLTMATTSGNPSINFHGEGRRHAIRTPLSFNQPLDLNTDQTTSVGVTDTIQSSSPLNKRGGGHARFSGQNDAFFGQLNILEGSLRGASAHSLGMGPVVVDGGELMYAAADASGNTGPVVVKTGTLYLEDFGPNDHFQILAGGAIAGDPTVLANLSPGQLALQPGAMIVHSDPNDPNAGNPPNLANDPLYIYGVSGSVPAGDMAVGSASATPWIGIGGVRGENSIGDPANTIQVLGSATIMVMPDGALDVHSKLVGGGGTLSKEGTGIARLYGDHTYAGPVDVKAGALLINGSLTANVTVRSGATVGGAGILIGMLQASEDGSAVSPGDEGFDTLTVSKLTLGQNTVLDFGLDTPDSSDLIIVTGDLVLDGQLFISVADNFRPGLYPIMQWGGSLVNNGLEIASQPGGINFLVLIVPNGGHGEFTVSDNQGNGGTVYLQVVPEPSVLGMMALAAAAGALRRRKR